MYDQSVDSKPQVVPIFPHDLQSIQESTAQKRRFRSSLQDTFLGSPYQLNDNTKTTRAESFGIGTNASLTERKQYSSCRKKLILVDDMEITEEPLHRETTKLSAEEYTDFVE